MRANARLDPEAGNRHRDGLVDRGANGGMAGDDMLILATDPVEKVDITGIDDVKMDDIPVVTACTKLHCERNGTVIGLFYQYAGKQDEYGYGTGQTIHAPIQLGDFGLTVNDNVTERNNRILTPDGFEFKLYTRGGLPHMRQARPTLEDLGKYPHVIMTAAEEVGGLWDPTKFDTYCTNELEDDIPALIDHAD